MIKTQHIHIPIMSFRANGSMYYKIAHNHRGKLLKSEKFNENAKLLTTRKRYIGFVTPEMVKRMKKAITLMIQSTPWKYVFNPVTEKTQSHKLSFITLTIPKSEKSTDAKYCHKELLEPFLRILRERHSLKSYIWKCELQKNGSVHYHITVDILIHHKIVKETWNRLMKSKGMLDDFFKKYDSYEPNSTDIHAVYKINNLEAYLVKYITKEYQNESKLNGKIWDCSMNLKKSDYFKFQVDSLTALVIKQLQDSKQVITHYFEKAIFFDFKTSDYYSFFQESIFNQFFNHLKSIRSWKRQKNSANQKSERNLLTQSESLNRPAGRKTKEYLQATLAYCMH